MAPPPTIEVELRARGLYDPDAPDAAAQLELLTYLLGLGATVDELVEYRDGLPGLASVVTVRGSPAITLAEAAQRSGLSEDKVLELTRAGGFPAPGPDDRVFGDGIADLASGIAAAEQLFGEQAVLQLVRVMGSSMSRLADAIVSAFLVNVEPAVRGTDPVGLGVARANADGAALLPFVAASLDTLLRQHLLAARRTILGDAVDPAFETQRLVVGFVDLVGSTALAQRLSTRELGAVLTEFENAAADAVTDGGGRVVKHIGDEILFTAPDEQAGCAIALALATTFADHPRVPPTRAGLAAGDVLLRAGDVFGPVVILAARAVKLAAPGELVAEEAVVASAGVDGEPVDGQLVKGFDGAVRLRRIRQAGSGSGA
jgi:adenylate cyclase